jgi:hypothetical protein
LSENNEPWLTLVAQPGLRKIRLVLALEARDGLATPFEIDGYTAEQVGYHSHLLIEGGLADGGDITPKVAKSRQTILIRLTWNGHEFADSTRDEIRWKKARTVAEGKAGTVTTAVLTQLLTSLMKAALSL